MEEAFVFRRILLTLAAGALSACSDSTAPKASDCSAQMAATGKTGMTSGTHGTNADGSQFETWYYGTGSASDPFHSITFTWGGPLSICQVTEATAH